MTYPYIASLSLLWASVGTFCGVVPGGPGAPVGEVPTPGMTWLPRPADPGLPEEGVWLLVGVAAAPVGHGFCQDTTHTICFIRAEVFGSEIANYIGKK